MHIFRIVELNFPFGAQVSDLDLTHSTEPLRAFPPEQMCDELLLVKDSGILRLLSDNFAVSRSATCLSRFLASHLIRPSAENTTREISGLLAVSLD
jgi:hypothetical protein